MLILLLDLYSLLNNKEANREEIKAKLLRMIRQQMKKDNLALNDLGAAYFRLNNISKAEENWEKAAKLGNQASKNNLKELERLNK